MKSLAECIFDAIVSGGWAVESDGDVESPTGHFALVEIPKRLGERVEMFDSTYGPNWIDEENDDNLTPEPGWYVVTRNNEGITSWNKVADRESAEFLFSQDLKAYSAWQDDSADALGITAPVDKAVDNILSYDNPLASPEIGTRAVCYCGAELEWNDTWYDRGGNATGGSTLTGFHQHKPGR